MSIEYPIEFLDSDERTFDQTSSARLTTDSLFDLIADLPSALNSFLPHFAARGVRAGGLSGIAKIQ
ncbi:MAG: hypothetical protein ACRBBQ_13750 [Cognatishimia sp.]